MKDFFISYTAVDKDWAEWLAWILEEADYKVFVQAWDILAGNNFVAEMQRAMTETHRTIAVLSESYFSSKYTAAEWAAAITRDPLGESRVLIPIKIKECKTEGFFASTVYIDVIGRTEQDARAAILGAFGSRRAKPTRAPIYPGLPGTDSGRVTPSEHAPFPGISEILIRNSTDNILDTSSESLMTAPLHQVFPGTNSSVFTAEERLQLRKNLDRITLPQLNMMVFALAPPVDAIPPVPAAQSDRIDALLTWVEGSTGPGPGGLSVLLKKLLTGYESQEPSPNSDRGQDVARTCDRRSQERQFNLCFKRCVETGRAQTQFYIIHGPDMEGHESLVERLCGTTIRTLGGGNKPAPWKPEWPQSGVLEVDAEQLVSALFESAGRSFPLAERDNSAQSFREIIRTLPPVIAVMHNIDAKDWLRTTPKLIQYHAEFWDEVNRTGVPGSRPQFVVFFNVRYPDFENNSWFPRRQWHRLKQSLKIKLIKRRLRQLSGDPERSPQATLPPQKTSIVVLEELKCVTLTHVKEWLGRHQYGEYEWQWVEQSQRIFTENHWELFECRRMAEVEWALAQFVQEMTPARRIFNA